MSCCRLSMKPNVSLEIAYVSLEIAHVSLEIARNKSEEQHRNK